MKARVFRNLDSVPSIYREFLNQIEHDNFFYGARWFDNFSNTALEPHATVHIYAVEDGASTPRPRALLMARSPAGQNGSLLQDRSLGERTLASMTSYQSMTFAPLVRDEEEDLETVMHVLVKKICSERPSWSLIDLNLMDPTSPVFQAAEAAFREEGMRVYPYVYAECVYERIEGRSFAEFLQSRRSVVRKTFQRRLRSLERQGEGRFELIAGPADVERGILNYERVCAQSWKDAEPFPKHTAGLIRASAAADALRLGFLYFGDEPIATQIWIVSSGKASIYKLHYNLGFKKYSVGSVLTARMMEHAIDVDRVEEVNFGVGSQPHKRDWLHKSRPLGGLLVFNPRTAGGIREFVRYRSRKVLTRIRTRVRPIVQRARANSSRAR